VKNSPTLVGPATLELSEDEQHITLVSFPFTTPILSSLLMLQHVCNQATMSSSLDMSAMAASLEDSTSKPVLIKPTNLLSTANDELSLPKGMRAPLHSTGKRFGSD
jgi:hypothetical protein